ncbi:MAG: hypothetical protein ACKO0V_03280, partial [bacterium]
CQALASATWNFEFAWEMGRNIWSRNNLSLHINLMRRILFLSDPASGHASYNSWLGININSPRSTIESQARGD